MICSTLTENSGDQIRVIHNTEIHFSLSLNQASGLFSSFWQKLQFIQHCANHDNSLMTLPFKVY